MIKSSSNRNKVVKVHTINNNKHPQLHSKRNQTIPQQKPTFTQ